MRDDFPSHVVLGVNEELRIALRSLATAGYQWRGSVGGPDPDAVGLELHRGELPAASKIGVSAPEEAVLRGIRPGRAIVRLEQRRPWERDSPAAELLQLEVEVRESSQG